MRFQLRNENVLKDRLQETGKAFKIFELSCEACDAKRGICVFTKINTTKITFNKCLDSNSVNCRGKRNLLPKKTNIKTKIKLVKIKK